MTTEEWNKMFFELTPVVGGFISLLSLGIGITSLSTRRIQGQGFQQDGKYLVNVRFPGQWYDLRDFVQPDNPDVMNVLSQVGPDPWALYDFVCKHVSYKLDWREFFQFPSETLRGRGDCEDSSILLTSLIRAGGVPDCFVALGSLEGYGHAWCQLNGQILETTYSQAQPVPDPEDYYPYIIFHDQEVIEFWPGALEEVFNLERDEVTKLNLMAEVMA